MSSIPTSNAIKKKIAYKSLIILTQIGAGKTKSRKGQNFVTAEATILRPDPEILF